MLHWSLDMAQSKDAMQIDRMHAFLDDIHHSPGWRVRADIEGDYYDSNQYDPSLVAELESRGLPIIVVNLIKPTIDVVLGMEAQTRTDWEVLPESGKKDTQLAKALSVKMKEIERLTQADVATADAFEEQVKVGLGWVEVGRESDPFKYKYRIDNVGRREIFWDSRSRKPDLSDARYVCRRKWHDVDHVRALFPKYAPIIDHAGNHMAHWDPTQFTHSYPYLQDNLIERDWGLDEAEWRDSERRRLMIYEVWYRMWERGFVIAMPDGRVVEYNKQNAIHQAAIATGYGEVKMATYSKMRLSWWMGPVRFLDMPTPHPHNHFPYVPFWGYREDRTRVPYGMIRAMMPLQDEINARRSKMMWQLSARMIITEEDAVKDHNAVQQEISRPDAYIILNKDRINRIKGLESFKINEHTQLSEQQFRVYEDSKQTLQDAAGIYQQMLGKSGGVDSGVAIDALIQQGQTTLAKLFSNYKDGRRRVGELALNLLMVDMGETLEEVEVDGRSGQKTIVILNEGKYTRQGLPYRNNDVTRANMIVALSSNPNTATYRKEQFRQLSEMTKSLTPEMQAMVMDIVIEASDLKDKDLISERFRQMTGVASSSDPAELTEKELQQFEQAIAKSQEQAAKLLKAEKLANAEIASKTHKQEAQAELAEAKADQTRVETDTAVSDSMHEHDRNVVELHAERIGKKAS